MTTQGTTWPNPEPKLAGAYPAATDCSTPRTIPPRTQPPIDPAPPRIRAGSARNEIWSMAELMPPPTSVPSITPARTAAIVAQSQATVETTAGLMPCTRAASGSEEMARMATPILVRCSRYQNAPSSTSVIAMTDRSRDVNETEPSETFDRPHGSYSASGCEPQIAMTSPSATVRMPIPTSMTAKNDPCPPPLLMMGLKRIRSSPTTAIMDTTTSSSTATPNGSPQETWKLYVK